MSGHTRSVTGVDIESIPPHFGRAFLDWLRAATESAWDRTVEWTLADYQRAGVGGLGWRTGTRWSGSLAEPQIDDIERRHGLRFPPQHRFFLGVLHATQPRCRGAGFIDDRNMIEDEAPGFYNWLTDDHAIRAALAELIDGLVFDVENNALWPASWGPRPGGVSERRARVEELVARAPKLIPIIGHRFILDAEPHAVLSVYQSDIIVYGADLRSFLLHELQSLLELEHDPQWENADVSRVPFWGELVG